MQIDIDFDVFKALTALRLSETVTYNDVVRALLGLPPTISRHLSAALTINLTSQAALPQETGGYAAADRWLPNGTELQTTYKGERYTARIEDGGVVSKGGKSFKSLSAAAKDITGNNVNGLRFWKARVPGHQNWTLVAALPKKELS